ncbi:MAG: hypothetical protein KGJ89_04390 [Patescibacteria group bacterium]|nr:hypothetical protein [Patescibacteria group bacterium]MDE2015361.1 hypothetical protein [Patescibacteria group bacterium]MDE2227166.1 hypothetical protein [Patescibacteria group bacterium]
MKKTFVSIILLTFLLGGVSFAQAQNSSSSTSTLRYPTIHFPGQMPPPSQTGAASPAKHKTSSKAKQAKKPIVKKPTKPKKKLAPKVKKVIGAKPPKPIIKKTK